MTGLCLTLVFNFYAHCLIASGFDYSYCGITEKEFKPIYEMYQDSSCNDTLDKMYPKLYCEEPSGQ